MSMVNIGLAGKIVVEIGGALYQFTLPEPLYSLYLETIVGIEEGSIDTYTGELTRRDLHERLIDWWLDKMPHVSAATFSKSLEYVIEHDLPYYRYLLADCYHQHTGPYPAWLTVATLRDTRLRR